MVVGGQHADGGEVGCAGEELADLCLTDDVARDRILPAREEISQGSDDSGHLSDLVKGGGVFACFSSPAGIASRKESRTTAVVWGGRRVVGLGHQALFKGDPPCVPGGGRRAWWSALRHVVVWSACAVLAYDSSMRCPLLPLGAGALADPAVDLS